MTRLPKRKPDSHKGDYGRILIVAGAPGMAGAAILAGEAAYRSGAGLVYYACPSAIAGILSIKQTCGIVLPFPEHDPAPQILDHAAKCDVAVIGPGLSQTTLIAAAVRDLVDTIKIPFVLDADGLNAFESAPALLGRGGALRILTPHPGEAARLLQIPVSEVQADRTGAARMIAKRFRAIAVLKGHQTVVTDGEKVRVNKTGNPGMATAGSGDVLAGVIAGLIGQKMDPYEAACFGVDRHGRAGDLAARAIGPLSLMATDILEALPRAFKMGA